MKIKEQDSDRLVIVPTLGERFKGIALLAMAIGLLVLLVAISLGTPFDASSVLPVLGFAVLFLYFAGCFIGKRVVLDKLTGSIILKERRFMLIPIERVIPFSAVTGVPIEKRFVGGQHTWPHDEWKVSIDTSSKKVKIAQTRKHEDMLCLADTISRFIGKKEGLDETEMPRS